MRTTGHIAFGALLVAAACGLAHAADDRDCPPRGGLRFICGTGAVEDLAPVPGTPFLLAGGMRTGGPAPLQVIDARDESISTAWPAADGIRADRSQYPDCPGPPDPGRMSTTGVALQTLEGTSLFYAVNEADRRAIEVFEVAVDTSPGAAPPVRLTWVGCVPMPEGTNPNAVTPLAGRAMAIASMDNGAANRMTRHARGDATGSVWTWRPSEGLRKLPIPDLRGGNGIAATADHRWLFVSAWSGSQLVRIAVDGSVAPSFSEVPFLPDNIKLAPDGSLLLAAQLPPIRRIALCQGNNCPTNWQVSRIDPATMRRSAIRGQAGSAQMNYATGAVEHEGRIWVTNRGDGRILVLPTR